MNVNCWVWGNIMLVRQPICHNQANVSSFKRKTPWGLNTLVVLDMSSMGIPPKVMFLDHCGTGWCQTYDQVSAHNSQLIKTGKFLVIYF